MRIQFTLLALGLSLQLFSQNQLLGLVVDASSQKPISYVNVGVFDKNIGTVSDAKGSFSLNLDGIVPVDTIVFSIVGYKKIAYPLHELLRESPLKIHLKEDIVKLSEVVVEIDPSNSKILGVEKVSGKRFGFIGGIGAGAEISRKMVVSKPSILQTASIYVRNRAQGPFKLRLNVYTVNRKGGVPGQSLLTHSIVLESDLKEGWLTYDFEEPLVIDEPFYISYEWVEADIQNPMIALRGNSPNSRVKVRPVSMGRWIMSGNFDFAIQCEVMYE